MIVLRNTTIKDDPTRFPLGAPPLSFFFCEKVAPAFIIVERAEGGHLRAPYTSHKKLILIQPKVQADGQIQDLWIGSQMTFPAILGWWGDTAIQKISSPKRRIPYYTSTLAHAAQILAVCQTEGKSFSFSISSRRQLLRRHPPGVSINNINSKRTPISNTNLLLSYFRTLVVY